MAVTIDALWAKVDRLAKELAGVQQELEQLRTVKPLTPEEWWAARQERLRRETEELCPIVDALFERFTTGHFF